MKVVTWNVNSLRARLERVLEFLEVHSPDALLLQETKCSPEQFPADQLAAAGYDVCHHSGGRWAGVAVLAPKDHGLKEAQVGLPGEASPDQARWIEADIESLAVRVASVYVVNGQQVGSEPFAQKLQFLAAMAERAEQLKGSRLVVGGDMNVAPLDIDVYDPTQFVGATHVTDEERAGLRAAGERGALVDAYRLLHADEPGFTWWDYRGGSFHRGFGLRIDLLLVSESLAAAVTSCGIDRDFRKGTKPSDHAPLIVELAAA